MMTKGWLKRANRFCHLRSNAQIHKIRRFCIMSSASQFERGLVGVGDNVVDHYLDQGVYYPGGNALNVAILAHRFGVANSAYIGILGCDQEGAHVRASILAEGLSDSQLRVVKGETGKAKVTLVDGDRVFVGSNKGGVRKRVMLRMDDDDLDLISRLGHVHSSCFSYLEPELPRIRAIAHGLSFDFSTGRDRDYFAAICPLATIAFFSGSDMNDAETEAFIREAHLLGAQTVCVTQGERGAVFSDGRSTLRQGIVQAKVVDTMGAGDAFIGGFLAAMLQGASSEASLLHGATSAAAACEWSGAFGYPHPTS
ncbi:MULTISPECIES: PfkB family carbohydrate kinase [unclassified Mesorhizobium]|uniref:PfkB family carbohydrate kinase n=1 Tax=unclassified Mesorhizobium TaxID=325217 RepID=UPI0024160536|nr:MULTISPECIES: PfkB family carbohydrate kinase [unclassified Mesorhizobium]WFP65629.1 PfkB family carbohydrate kinase [Mesorhizobium sp. WSM4904]WFP78893.1 PfkB family carbohydrate kinase [Mesorhizobium sp. WSM4906]